MVRMIKRRSSPEIVSEVKSSIHVTSMLIVYMLDLICSLECVSAVVLREAVARD